MSSPEREPTPTVKIFTPSFDASSAASSGSLSVSSPSVSSRITCPRVASDAPALPRRATSWSSDGADGAADGGAAHRHVPRVEVQPEQLHRRVVGGRRVDQRLARERDHADAIVGQRSRAARPARASTVRGATGRCRSPASSARSRARPPDPGRAAWRGATRPGTGAGRAPPPSAPAPRPSAPRAPACAPSTRRRSCARPAPRPPAARAGAAARRRRRRRRSPPPEPTATTRARGADEAHGQGIREKRVRRSAISAASSANASNRKRRKSSAYSMPRSWIGARFSSARIFWKRSAQRPAVAGEVGRPARHRRDLLEQLRVHRLLACPRARPVRPGIPWRRRGSCRP